MLVLLISSKDMSSNYGGGQVYLKNILEELIRQNLDIIIAEPGEGLNQSEAYKGISVFSFDKKGDAGAFIRFLKELKPDLVHAHGYKAEFAKACSFLGIPCIVTAHHGGILCPAGTLLNYKDEICKIKAAPNNCLPCVLKRIKFGQIVYPVLSRLPLSLNLRISRVIAKAPFVYVISPILSATGNIQNKLNQWQEIVSYSTLIISPSFAMAESMKRNGADPGKIRIVPHGIPKPNVKLEEPMCKDKKSIRFFYVGRVNYIKGLHIMINAFTQVGANAELHIIGGTGNKEEERYMKQLKRLSAKDDRIKWYGKVDKDKMNDLVKTFDVLIHPAIYMEVYGLNIAEALAQGKPVIATKCGGAEMQIVEGLSGLLIQPNDVEALKDSILNIIKNKPYFEIDIANVIDITSHVNHLMSLYKQTVKGVLEI
jgi:glycosyltransferase involved in cell wall biosynthesis